MLKKYPRIKIFLAALDLFLLMSALTISFLIRYKSGLFGETLYFPWIKFLIFLILLIPFISISKLNNLYKQRIFLNSLEQFVQILKSLLILIAIYVFVLFILRHIFIEHSRSLLSLFFIISLFFLVSGRIIIFRTLYKLINGNGILKRRIIVVGAGDASLELLSKIKGNPYEDIEILCIFDDDPKKKGRSLFGAPVLGTTDDLEFYLQKLKIAIDGIYISINFISYENLINLIRKCKKYGYPVYLNSQHFKVINDRVNVHEFESLLSPPIYIGSSDFYKVYIKRLIDIIFAIVVLAIVSPLFFIISIMIKITSKGPVFYKPKVVGKDGKEFIWYKFRTMKINQNPSVHNKFMYEMIKNKKKEGTLKIKNDERVTKIGKFLRKLSLDELPQLINVLKGQMSLIGPRPCSQYECSLYEEWHKKRFSATPGITGLWQAFGRSSVGYDDLVIMDLYYIENISFWIDLKIFLKTIPVVLLGKGGY